MLNLPQLVHSKKVTRTIPSCVLNDRPPEFSYKYPQTISRKIWNHRKTVKDINFDIGSSSMTCSCCESSLQNKDVGHVVTWDLRTVKDRCL